MPSVPPPVMTCGEPAGVGPEIAAGAWRELRDAFRDREYFMESKIVEHEIVHQECGLDFVLGPLF